VGREVLGDESHSLLVGVQERPDAAEVGERGQDRDVPTPATTSDRHPEPERVCTQVVALRC
jgi:hypothetical protein